MLSKVLLTAKLSQEWCCSVLLFPLGAPIPNYRTLEIQETCNHRQELCQLFPLSRRGYGSISLQTQGQHCPNHFYVSLKVKTVFVVLSRKLRQGASENTCWENDDLRYWSATLGEPHLHGQILRSPGRPSNLIWDFKADSELTVEIQQCCLSQRRGLAWQSAPPRDPALSWFCCMRARETCTQVTGTSRAPQNQQGHQKQRRSEQGSQSKEACCVNVTLGFEWDPGTERGCQVKTWETWSIKH